MQKLLKAQSLDIFYKVIFRSVETLHLEFSVNKHRLSVRCSAVEGCTQTMVGHSHQQVALYPSHSTPITGHLEQTRMYESLRREYYKPYMAHKIFAAVDTCKNRALI